MKYLLLLLSLFISVTTFAADCESKKIQSEYRPRYARLFSIRYYDHFKIVESKDDRFLVGDDKLDCTTKLPIFTSKTKRFVATSTTHLPFLSMLGLEDTLVGFQGVRYIYNPRLKKQTIKDINYQLNPEELLSMKADLIMAYSANVTGNKRVDDLRKLHIPIVLNHDFEEKHPLARAEWLVFSSIFFGKDDMGKVAFSKIEKSYNEFKRQSKALVKKKILVGDIQNGKWATCGGLSDLNILISDAGGELLLKSSSTETQYLSLEEVLKLKVKPDIWLSQNTWMDLISMKKDSRYKIFSGIPVYNNVKQLNSDGFNDYWETGVSRPDLLLKDLVGIFHPGKISKDDFIWYKKI